MPKVSIHCQFTNSAALCQTQKPLLRLNLLPTLLQVGPEVEWIISTQESNTLQATSNGGSASQFQAITHSQRQSTRIGLFLGITNIGYVHISFQVTTQNSAVTIPVPVTFYPAADSQTLANSATCILHPINLTIHGHGLNAVYVQTKCV